MIPASASFCVLLADCRDDDTFGLARIIRSLLLIEEEATAEDCKECSALLASFAATTVSLECTLVLFPALLLWLMFWLCFERQV